MLAAARRRREASSSNRHHHNRPFTLITSSCSSVYCRPSDSSDDIINVSSCSGSANLVNSVLLSFDATTTQKSSLSHSRFPISDASYLSNLPASHREDGRCSAASTTRTRKERVHACTHGSQPLPAHTLTWLPYSGATSGAMNIPTRTSLVC